MRISALLIAILLCPPAFAKLPPPSEEETAKAAETTAKAAWSNKLAQYQLCLAMDRTAAAYRKSTRAAGNAVPVPVATPPCADPGPYTGSAAVDAARPREAAAAHSPPETAVLPPSTEATEAEIDDGS
jgi:hypothetical protein